MIFLGQRGTMERVLESRRGHVLERVGMNAIVTESGTQEAYRSDDCRKRNANRVPKGGGLASRVVTPFRNRFFGDLSLYEFGHIQSDGLETETPGRSPGAPTTRRVFRSREPSRRRDSIVSQTPSERLWKHQLERDLRRFKKATTLDTVSVQVKAEIRATLCEVAALHSETRWGVEGRDEGLEDDLDVEHVACSACGGKQPRSLSDLFFFRTQFSFPAFIPPKTTLLAFASHRLGVDRAQRHPPLRPLATPRISLATL